MRGGKEMLRGEVIQRKAICTLFQEGGSEFAEEGVSICRRGGQNLVRGGGPESCLFNFAINVDF